jgi:putative aldouronate transport system substrate-binding protein
VKKRFLLLSLILLTLLAVSGAGLAQSEPITIRIFAPQDAEQDLATNAFTHTLEEKFNVHFEWTVTTQDGTSAAEQRNLALASGDYPDVFMLIPWVDQFSQLDLLRYGQQGVILPLNDLIDEYAPNVAAAMKTYPDLRILSTAPDGTIWGLPQLNQCYHCSYGNKMWVNSSWMHKLGLETPKTVEEFRDMLVAFQKNDANGNGVPDELLTGGQMEFGTRLIPFFMNGFIYDDDRTYLMLNNGQVETVANTQAWRDGLTFIKSMWDAGVIDPGAFTNNGDALESLGHNASAEMLSSAAGMHPYIFFDCGDDADPAYCQDYDAIPPLQGPNSAFSTYLPNWVPGATFVLTNKASKEVQIATMQIMNYLFTEEGILTGMFGVENVNWRRPIEGEVALDSAITPLYTRLRADPPTPNNSWGAIAQYLDPVELRNAQTQATDIYTSDGFERRLLEATKLYDGKESPDLFPFWLLWPDPATADEQALLKQNITDYIVSNSLGFVTGSLSLETDWDSYVEGLNNLGLARYLELNQAAYDAMMASKKQ